jgi:RNA polymerase-binding transcription factor DksA
MELFERVAKDALISRKDALHRLGSPLTEEQRAEVVAIDAALSRIAKGSYGHCEQCGRAIGRQRLRAIPEAKHCASCE